MKLYLIGILIVAFLLNGCVYEKVKSNIYIEPELSIKDFEYKSNIILTNQHKNALVIQMRTAYRGRIDFWTGYRLIELLVLIKNFDHTAVDKIYDVDGKEATYRNDFYEHKGIKIEKISGKVRVKKISKDFIRFYLSLLLVSENEKVKKINKTITFKKGEIYFGEINSRDYWYSRDEKIKTVYPQVLLKFLLNNDVYEILE